VSIVFHRDQIEIVLFYDEFQCQKEEKNQEVVEKVQCKVIYIYLCLYRSR
jgi:hypothetical protein